MLRHFLTLLALITGLAATAANAEVRLSGQENVRLEAGAEQVAACQAITLAEQLQLPPVSKQSPVEINYCLRAADLAVVPTVMIGIDRSRQ